jgi:M6 family metalloprotease-like protein
VRTFVISVCLVIFAGSLGAVDLSKGFMLDIPRDIAAQQMGRALVSTMTPEDSLAVTSFRFSGDTLRLLAVLVDWNDRPHLWSPAKFDSLLFSQNVWPGGSVRDYIWECSYGQVVTTGTVIGWIDGGDYNSGYDFGSLFSVLDATVDFTQYDGDHNGDVDAVVFIRSRTGMEDTGNPNDIWSYAYIFPPHSGWGPHDGMWIPRWNTSPETRPLRNPLDPTQFTGLDTLNRIRVFAHELHHNLGLPDLYDYNSKLDIPTFYTPNDANDHPVYDWDIMAYYGYGILSLGSEISSHLTGWSKKSLGWLTPITLNDASYTALKIYDIETHADSSLYMIPINQDGTEYFLLEYRNPQSTAKFDKKDSDFSCYFHPDLKFGCDPLDRGLLITHIDDQYEWGNNGTPASPHYHVMVEDAGYNPSYDYTNNPGGAVSDSAQWWYPYETRKGALFSSETPGQTTFGPTTVPNSDGYTAPTGLTVIVDSIVGDHLFVRITQKDTDEDGIIDRLDQCPLDAGNDADGDALCANADNCPNVSNPLQQDANHDGIGDACCCIGITGNVDCDPGNGVDISDLAALIDYLYITFSPLCCPKEANTDGDISGGLDISDLSALIDYLYISFTPVGGCQ